MSLVESNSQIFEDQTTVEAALDPGQVHQLMRQDLDFFAAIAAPLIYRYAFPPLYKAAWDWVISRFTIPRDFSQLALGMPRGFAKTFLIKLMVLYAILFTKKRFILVISENEAKAVSIISDVCDMLNEPNIKAVFGDWGLGIVIDQQAKKVFGFRGRTIILKAAGAESGIRGITEKNVRPDVMIFDDIQSRESSESELVAQNLEKWMLATAMKAKSPEGCTFLFVANMYATKGSLLRKLKRNPNWLKFIMGGLDHTGNSIWEDLQPTLQLLREFQNDLIAGHPEIFYAEVLNDENASMNNLVDLSLVPEWMYQEDDIPGGAFIIIDPSNDKLHSDKTAIGLFKIYDGFPCLIEHIYERLSPRDTIIRAIEMAMRNLVSIIAIESTAYQASLNYWFAFTCQQMGILGLQPVEVYPGSLSKHSRILSMIRGLPKGEVKLHPQVRPEIYLQITQFNPLKRDNDDGLLDLLCYAPKVQELYGIEILSATVIAEQEHNARKVYAVEDNSPF